jgi:hypothetical protein
MFKIIDGDIKTTLKMKKPARVITPIKPIVPVQLKKAHEQMQKLKVMYTKSAKLNEMKIKHHIVLYA